MVSYSPNVTQIKLFFKFDKFDYRFPFQSWFALYESRDVSKKTLKSPAKTIYFSEKSLIASYILPWSGRVVTCSVSVLGLYMLTRIKLVSSSKTSNVKTRIFSSSFLSKTSSLLFAINPIATLHELV